MGEQALLFFSWFRALALGCARASRVLATIRVLPPNGLSQPRSCHCSLRCGRSCSIHESRQESRISVGKVVGISKEIHAMFADFLETHWTTEGQRQRQHESLVASKQTINEQFRYCCGRESFHGSHSGDTRSR